MSVVSFERFTSPFPDPLTEILSVMALDLYVVAA